MDKRGTIMRKGHFFPLCIMIICILSWSSAFGDTIFKAGDGNNLIFGRSVVTVNLPDSRGKDKDIRCLLMGTVKGKPAVYPLDPGPEYNNKLYLVEIIDSTKAYFANRVPNIVPVVMTGTSLDRVIGYSTQPLGRILEIADPDNENEPILLLTHGTGDLYMFSLVATKDPKIGITTLKAQQREKWSSPIRYINLDLIDLDKALANRDNKEPVPPTIAVWYQREGKLWDSRNFNQQPNSLALASFDKSAGLALYQTDLNGVAPFNSQYEGPDCWHLKGGEDHYTPVIVGGAFVNPDENGKVTYWFSQNYLQYEKRSWPLIVLNAVDTWHRLETWGSEIRYSKAEGRLTLEPPKQANVYWWEYWTKDWGKADTQIERFVRWATGPYVRTDETNQIYIDHYVTDPPHDDGPSWLLPSTVVGRLHIETDRPGEVRGISEYDGKSEEDLTAMEKRERALVNGNTNVTMVVYGWPYFAALGTPSPLNTPSFSRKEGTQHIGWQKGSYGGGFESKVGVGGTGGGGFLPLGEYSSTMIGGFSWESGTETTDVETTSVTISASYHDTPFDEFTRWGIVVYNTVKPKVINWYSFMPDKSATISVTGLEGYEFAFPVASFGVNPDTAMFYERFDVTRPEQLIGKDEKGNVIPSPLSAGLVPRDAPTTLTRENRDAAVKAIQAWEEKTKLKDFLTLIDKAGSGVTVNQTYSYKLDNDAWLSASKQGSKSTTDDKEWYGGFNWSYKPSLPLGPVLDITVKHTGSFSTKDTASTEKAYTLRTFGVTDSYLGLVKFTTYFIDINISALKSYIYRSRGKKNSFQEKPVFIPDWNWKYNQDFTLVVTQFLEVVKKPN